MKLIRFIHAADLHLDSPFKGLNELPHEIFQQVRESTFRAFAHLVDVALEEKVDFVVLAGDLFDLEQRSLLAQAKLRQEFLRLANENIPVYVIHGNHDYMTSTNQGFRYPDNVHIFQDRVEVKPFLKDGIHLANIYGFSYNKRHVFQNRTGEFKKEGKVAFHIGLLHGNLDGREDHDPYSPFTLSELLEKDFHYWALGHIHKREILHSKPPIVYPGNIQGRHKKETEEKGFYLAEITEQEAKLTFVETSNIIWKNIEFSISTLESMDVMLDRLKERFKKTRQEGKGLLIQLLLTGSGPLHANLQDENQIEDLLFLLNEEEEVNKNFMYVHSLTVQTTPAFSKETLKEKAFYQDFYSIVENTKDINPFLTPLFRHTEARHFLEAFDEEEKQDILKEAEQWLVTKFLEGEKG